MYRPTNGWNSEAFSVKGNGQTATLISMDFVNQKPTQTGDTIGLFGNSDLSTLATPPSQQNQKSGGSN